MDTELSCQQARAMVSAYMNQEVDAGQAQALESHLQHCSSCPALYASLVAVQQRLRQEYRPTLLSNDLLRIAQRVSDAIGGRHDESPA
jgi:anti-sigma factor RsiW